MHSTLVIAADQCARGLITVAIHNCIWYELLGPIEWAYNRSSAGRSTNINYKRRIQGLRSSRLSPYTYLLLGCELLE